MNCTLFSKLQLNADNNSGKYRSQSSDKYNFKKNLNILAISPISLEYFIGECRAICHVFDTFDNINFIFKNYKMIKLWMLMIVITSTIKCQYEQYGYHIIMPYSCPLTINYMH